MQSFHSPQKAMKLYSALNQKTMDSFVPNAQLIITGKTDKNPLLNLKYLNTIISQLKNMSQNELSPIHIKPLIDLIQRNVAWIIHDETQAQNHTYVQAVQELILCAKNLTRMNPFVQESQRFDYFSWCHKHLSSLHQSKDPLFLLETYLFNHLELFTELPQEENGIPPLISYLNHLIDITQKLKVNQLKIEHFSKFNALCSIVTLWFQQVRSIDSKGAELRHATYAPLLTIFNQLLSNLSSEQQKLTIDGESIETIFSRFIIDTHYLLARDYLVICNATEKAEPYFHLMEKLLAPVIAAYTQQSRTLSDAEIDYLELYYTLKVEWLIQQKNTPEQKEAIVQANDDLGYFFKKHTHLLRWNIAIQCLDGYEKVLRYYLKNGHYSEAIHQLELTENCLNSIKKKIKLPEFQISLQKAFMMSDHTECSKYLKKVEGSVQQIRVLISNTLQTQYLAVLKNTTLFTFTPLDSDTLILLPRSIQKKFLSEHKDEIFKILKRSGAHVSRINQTNSIMLTGLSSHAPTDFIKILKKIDTQIFNLMNKNALKEIKSRIIQIRMEQRTTWEHETITPPLMIQSTELNSITQSRIQETTIELPSPIEPTKKEEPRCFTLIHKHKNQGTYQVQLDPKIEQRLHEKELNKVISVLTYGEIGLSRPFGHGIFFFKPNLAKTKISRLFTKDDLKLPCVKVKPAREDIRLFGVVQEIDGEKHIVLDRFSKNSH